MLYYTIPLLILLFAAIKYDINGDKGSGKYVIWGIIFIYFTLLIGLRFEVGGDTIAYMGYWQWQKDITYWQFSLTEYFAPGYSLLTALCYTFSTEFYFFQIIHSLIFNTLLFVFLSRSTSYKFSALIVVFILSYLYFSTEILREAIALLIFAFNANNLRKGRWISYYVLVLCSLMFHFSAIILVILPFIAKINVNKQFPFYCVLIICISAILPQIIGIVFGDSSVLANYANRYIADSTHGKLADAMALLRGFVFPLFFVLIVKYGMNKPVKYENFIMIYMLLGLAAFFYPIIFARLSNYFVLFFAISLTDVFIDCIKAQHVAAKHNALILIMSFIIIYGSDYIMYDKYTRWVPYYSVFNPHNVDRDNYN